MLKDVVEVRPLEGYTVYLAFEDGVSGTLDLGSIIRFDGIFEPLRELANFAKVAVNPELGTICWPSGADLDPDVLYARLTGEALPVLETTVTAT
jgi:hypothetical protein